MSGAAECRPVSEAVAERLPYNHTGGMVIPMKTTLNIDDTVMRRLKRVAAAQGRTMSEMMESALRALLDAEERRDPEPLPPLPVMPRGEMLVDVADREALYRAMEE